MKKYFILLLMILVITPCFAVDYEIVEKNQTVKGLYKQKLEAMIWKEEKAQQEQAVQEASEDYVAGFADFEKWLKRQEAAAALAGALATSAQSMANQMTAQQLQQQQYQQQYLQMNQQQKQYSVNKYITPVSTYTSTKSVSGYPILDPYADPNYWKSRGY